VERLVFVGLEFETVIDGNFEWLWAVRLRDGTSSLQICLWNGQGKPFEEGDQISAAVSLQEFARALLAEHSRLAYLVERLYPVYFDKESPTRKLPLLSFC
jgi:hypothetical protein